MSATRWVIQDDEVYELQGHRYGTNDEGAPVLCSLVCADQGRHVHIDFW